MTTQSATDGTSRVSVHAGSPALILAIIPHLLGFTPESSMVIIGTERPSGLVKVTIRYDLPDPADPALAADIAGHAITILSSQRLPTALAVGYGPAQLVTPVADALRDQAKTAGIELPELLRAESGRYWSCDDASQPGCPEDGTPYDPAAHAAFAVAGRATVLASRDALAKSIGPKAGIADSMRLATRRAEQHATRVIARAGKSAGPGAARHAIAAEGLAAVADLIGLYRAGNRFRSLYQVAWLTVALKDLRIRDDAWARMDPRHRHAHRQLWTDVVRRAQPGHVAAPASLLAFTAWQDGNGALANAALDRALADDPDYSMADLLRQVISSGAPPSLARVPLTPEEVAAEYAALDSGTDDEPADDDQDTDHDPAGGQDAGSEPQPAAATC